MQRTDWWLPEVGGAVRVGKMGEGIKRYEFSFKINDSWDVMYSRMTTVNATVHI